MLRAMNFAALETCPYPEQSLQMVSHLGLPRVAGLEWLLGAHFPCVLVPEKRAQLLAIAGLGLAVAVFCCFSCCEEDLLGNK